LPSFSEQTSAVTVGESHCPLFRLMQRNSFRFGDFPCGTEFLGQDPKIHDDSQVMEQTSKIRFPGISKN
jgi:hypothetical protein